MNPRRNATILPLLCVLFIFFFIGGPHQYALRSYQAMWNLGHILFFSLFPLAIVSFKRIPNRYLIQCIVALAATVVTGTAIELMQFGFQHRTVDMEDLFRNLIGVMVCIFFLLPTRLLRVGPALRLMQATTLVLLSWQLLPVIIAVGDELTARRQFPLLSGFETPFEIDRWHADTELRIDGTVKRTGNHSLRVVIGTRKFAAVELRHFPRDWTGYRFLRFSIHNPLAEELILVCRIHDDDPAEAEPRYADRYKQRLRIPQGWQTFTISLDAVKHRPQSRLMDMQKIMSVSLFTLGLPHPWTLYIDDVLLL